MSETAVLVEPEVAWRIVRLLELGFKQVHAEDLAEITDVVYEARRLLDAGCCHQVAWLILRA